MFMKEKVLLNKLKFQKKFHLNLLEIV